MDMHYWGKVVTYESAFCVKRDLLLPLESDTVGAPRLYLDGTPYENVEKSDFCAAWLVRKAGW
eukprot:2913001-Pyramimonas_sp.AAC.1